MGFRTLIPARFYVYSTIYTTGVRRQLMPILACHLSVLCLCGCTSCNHEARCCRLCVRAYSLRLYAAGMCTAYVPYIMPYPHNADFSCISSNMVSVVLAGVLDKRRSPANLNRLKIFLFRRRDGQNRRLCGESSRSWRTLLTGKTR